MANSSDKQSIPDDWWAQPVACETLAKWFSHHLVILSIAYATDTGPRVAAVTGFPLRYRDLTVWVTAGHAIQQIESLKATSRIVSAGWVDVRGRIPIDLENREGIPVNKQGVDIGVLLVRGIEAAGLAAGSTIFLDPSVWKRADIMLDEAAGFYVVGAPEQLVNWQEPRDQTINFDLGVGAVPVARMEREPNGEPRDFWELRQAFYGRLVNFDMYREQFDSIKGMSGAPVFALKRTDAGRIRYHLVGIQSAWLEKSRIVRATPVEALNIMMVQIYERMEGQADS